MSIAVIIFIAVVLACSALPLSVVPTCPAGFTNGIGQCSSVVRGYLFRHQSWPGVLGWQTSHGGTWPVPGMSLCRPTGNKPDGQPYLPGSEHIRYRAKCNLWSQSAPVGAGPPWCNEYSLADIEKPAAQVGFFQRASQASPCQGTSILRPAVILMAGSTPEVDCIWHDGPNACTSKIHTYFKHAQARFTRSSPVWQDGKMIRPGLLRIVLTATNDTPSPTCCYPTGQPGSNGCWPNGTVFPEPWLQPRPIFIRDVNVSIDVPESNTYQHFIISAVEPIEQNPYYDPEHPENVPYHLEPNAPNEGITNDTFMQPQICYLRTGPDAGLNNRFAGDGLTEMRVPEGVRGITAYSHGDARVSMLKNYCDGCGFFGLPPEIEPCEYPNCSDLVENLWRHAVGKSAVTVKRWEDDPESRGWYVQYQNHVHVWFAQDGWFTQQAYFGPRPRFRWNAWFKGYITCTIHGDPDDAAFANWIRGQDSGFGVEYKPRFADGCNDVLQLCAGQPNAFGGEVYPAESAQQSCDYSSGDPLLLPPCLRAERPASQWIFPSAPSNVDPCLIPGNGFPECGVYLQIERKKFTDRDHEAFETQHGWAKFQASTTPPMIVLAGGDEP